MTATVFQLATPFITTLIQLALALFLYWIKDYDPLTRGYERYTKRFQFHKAEHELRAMAGVEPTQEDLERYRHSLQSSASWISANLTIASRRAKEIAMMITFLAMPYVGRAMLPAYLNSFSNQSKFLYNIASGTWLVAFFVATYITYTWLKRHLTQKLLSLSKAYKFLSYLGKIVND